jgi:hypothetical protein
MQKNLIKNQTYFGNFQWAAFGIQTMDRLGNGTVVGQMQSGIVAVVLQWNTLI